LTEKTNTPQEQNEVENVATQVAEEAPKKVSKKSSETADSTLEPPAFDWSMDDQGFGNYSEDEKKELEKLYDGTLSEINENTLVKGTIVSITDKDVVLNIGFKSDGLVARTEFRDLAAIKIGDEVEVMIEAKEDRLGQLVLSRKRAISERA